MDLDDRGRRTVPLWESGNIVSEGGVIDLVDEDAKEGGSLVVGIRLKLRVDLNDKRGSHCGEYAGLML